MTNPNTPQQPTGTGPVSGEPQPPFAPQQPYAQPGGYPQQPYPAQVQPAQSPAQQQPYAQPGQPYPQAYAQSLPPVPPPRVEQPARPARPKTDPDGVPYGVGPFTLREVLFLGAAALVLLASFLQFLGGDYVDVFGYASAWAPAPWLAVPAALVLVSAAVLVAVRRLVPARRLAVGSLSVDQFASAASVVTAGFYLGALFLIAGFTAWFGGGSDLIDPGAGIVVGLLASLLAVAVTTVAPRIPMFRAEFASRREVGAHPVARPATAVARRPRAEQQATPQQPAPYPTQTGIPMLQAGPGEFAAYRRKGVQPDPVDEPAFPGAGAAAVAYQPYSDAPTATSAEPDAGFGADTGTHPIAQPPADEREAGQPAVDEPVTREPVVDEPVMDGPLMGEPAMDEPVIAEPPMDEPGINEPAMDEPGVDEPVVDEPAGEDIPAVDERSAAPGSVAPGFVATEVPAVDPQSVAATPADEDRFDDDDEPATGDAPTGATAEPAPVSAFSHVSARTAAATDDAATASDDSGPIAESPTAVFSTQPFWVYSPVQRPVVDEVSGVTVFEIGPSAWALAILDRGSELVIRHDDGRVGVLQNLDGITRG